MSLFLTLCALSLAAGLELGGVHGPVNSQELAPADAPFRQGRLTKRRDGEIVLTGKRFEVHVHFDDVWVAKKALETVEAVWPVAMEYLASPGTEPPYPLEVHIYPTHQEYAEIEAILTDGWFQNTGSFAHWNSKTAHMEMAPPLHGKAAERIVISAQTREVLLHEAAHLAAYIVIPTYRWHPRWFSEGLAMSIEQETARRLGLLQEASDHPRYSTDQVLLQRLLEHDEVPLPGMILSESLEQVSFHERYALQLEFFTMIVQDYPDAYRAMIAEAKVLRGGAAFRQGLGEFMARTFDEESLERGLERRIASLAPAWYLDYRAFQIQGDLWTQVAFPDTPAVAWRTQPVGAKTYSLAGAFELLGPEMSVLLNRGGWNHLSIALCADGQIVVRRHGAEESTEVARVTCEDLLENGEHDFVIEVDGSRVRVSLDGSERVEFDARQDSMEGAWGLAVPAGAAGLWRGVELHL